MKVRKKSENVKKLVGDLNRHGAEKKSDFWRAVARSLNRPARKRYEVNLSRLEKNAKTKETIVVPGVVLGSGEIKKSLTVAALKFSKESRQKIEKAGGKCLDIQELFEKNPKGHKVRIMG